MPPSRAHFKVIKEDAPIRRLTFEDPPSWDTFTTTLRKLFDIPPSLDISISYTDKDHDKIIASSDEELAAMYDYSGGNGETGYRVTLITTPAAATPPPPQLEFQNDGGDSASSSQAHLSPIPQIEPPPMSPLSPPPLYAPSPPSVHHPFAFKPYYQDLQHGVSLVAPGHSPPMSASLVPDASFASFHPHSFPLHRTSSEAFIGHVPSVWSHPPTGSVGDKSTARVFVTPGAYGQPQYVYTLEARFDMDTSMHID